MRFILPGLLSVLICLNACNDKTENNDYDEHISSFKTLSQNFDDPLTQFKTIPFWVWNTKITRELIDRDLEDFQSRGFGGVFIHPRYGLMTEYLSDDWFELTRYAVAKGKELGLYVWLYDENSFPSGFAGGHVPAEMPESWNKGMALRLHTQTVLEPGEGIEYTHILMHDGEQYEDITDKLSEYKGQSGDFRLFEHIHYKQSKWYGGFSYVDLLHEGVTEKFIELTMSGYEEMIGEDFGTTVPGIFTDEPNISPAGYNQVMRWTPDLYDTFLDQWGYDLVPHLVSLFEETGDWKKVRHNYYSTLLQMFIDRWSRPWYDYTEKMNLKWTGHYWEHGWPSPYHGGDNMAMYAWHQVPGIDMLFNTWGDRPDQFGNTRAVKEMSSVANQFGRHRTLSETYGASGWELNFRDMKRNGDWEYVLGVNLMNQHLTYMTLMGDRKHDFPQSFSFHAPYWDYYHYQAEYFARLSMVLSSGEQVNDILVIEPTSTMWMYYSPVTENERMYGLGRAFEDFVDDLENHQIEYDLGCENIIKDQGEIRNGLFVINKREYKLVILPPGLENLDMATAKLLGDFLDAGGKILSFVNPPSTLDGANNPMLRDMLDKYEGQCTVAGGKITGAELKLMASAEIQFSGLDESVDYLFHHRRELDEGQIVFLVNSSLDKTARGNFHMSGKSVALMDAESGKINNYYASETDGKLSIEFDIAPAASQLFYISEKKLDYPEIPVPPVEWTAIMPEQEMDIQPTNDNVLVLDYCLLTLGDEFEKEQYFYTASDKIFKHHGFDDNPWVSSSQYKTEISDRDTFSLNTSGFMADFVFQVAEGTESTNFRMVIERPELFMLITVNGQPVDQLEGEWWLDPEFGVFPIGEVLQPGRNEINLLVNPMMVHLELEPVFVLGDFSVYQEEKGWSIGPAKEMALGSWKEQGRPFYSESTDYTKTYQVDDPEKIFKLKLGAWNGTVAVVEINGEEAGIIYSEPYELDVSGLLAKGENNIRVKIVGSLKNLLGPHHNVSREGLVTPWSFKFAPEQQPPGSGYDLIDYGLFEDFELLEGVQ